MEKVYFEKTGNVTTYTVTGGVAANAETHTVGFADGTVSRMRINLPQTVFYGAPRIKRAVLTLKRQGGGTAPALALYRVTNSQSMTLDTHPVDYVPAWEGDSCSFDITDAVMLLYREPTLPNMLMLCAADETAEGTVCFGGSSGSANKPSLSVSYENTWGMDTGYPARCHSIGGAVQAETDLYWGDLKLCFNDFSWGGIRMPVSLEHRYSSSLGDMQYTYDKDKLPTVANFSKMQLGLGWRLNVMQSMVLYVGRYVYTDGSGKQTIFLRSDRQVTPEEGDPYYLYRSSEDEDVYYDPQKRTMELGGMVYAFDSTGHLIRIADEKGNAMTVSYSAGQIARVTDGAGRRFVFAYDDGDCLTGITAPDGTAVTYTYQNGCLQTVTRPDGSAVSFGTGSNGCISMARVSDPAGSVVHQTGYTWGINYQLTQLQQREYGNGSSKMAGIQRFIYTPAEGKTTVMVSESTDSGTAKCFDLVYAFDREGQLAGQYLSDADLGNRPVTDDAVEAYLDGGALNVADREHNLLLNPDFTTAAHWDVTAGTDRLECWRNSQNTAHNPTNLTGMAMYSLSQDNVAVGMTQTVDAPVGENTFSAWVSCGQITGGENPGVYLRITNAQGIVLGESPRLCQGEKEIRLSTTVSLGVAQQICVQAVIDGAGDAEIDHAQLENNGFVSGYCLLKNGSFECGEGRLESSTGDILCKDGSWVLTENATVSQEESFIQQGALKIAGAVDAPGCASQSTGITDYAGYRKTFTLSGWAKAAALPQKEGENAPRFCLQAVLHYAGGETECFTADFAPATTDWQYTQVQFAKSRCETVTDVEVQCLYSNNHGNAYFDNIQLVCEQEESGLETADFVTDAVELAAEEPAEEAAAFEELMDAFGNALTETDFHDGEFGTVYRSFGYDESGNDLIRETDARGNVTAYTVDPATSRNTSVTDRCGTKTAYSYDAMGRTTGVSVADPENAPLADVSYAYDSFDNLTTITRGDGMGYGLAYDVMHNLQSIGVAGKEEKLVTYGYKNKSRLKSVTYANGDKMELTYNALGQAVTEKWFDAAGELTAHYRYGYDDTGAVVRSVDLVAKKEYNYHYEKGELSWAVQCDVTVDADSGIVTGKRPVCHIRYSYADGQLKSKCLHFADGTERTVRYDYPEDSDAQVTFSAGDKSVTARSKTDSFGRKVFDEVQLGTGFVSRQFSYHAGEVTDEHREGEKLKSSATTRLVSQITLSDGRTIAYEYDPEERITKVTDSAEGVTEYTYDAMGQLLTEVKNGTAVNEMTYDAYGNILTKNGKVYTYGDSVWKDKVTAINGQEIVYDAQGNPVNYMGRTLTWEKGRQLKSFDGIAYTYNANGIRTSKTVNGVIHEYLLDGANILRETWGGNTLIPLYDNEEQVCGIEYNGTAYFFLKNLQGDVIAITDASGETVVRYSYDAWGACTVLGDSAIEIATVNPYRYRGYYFDTDTGLYYLQSRYYDPTTGRFLNGDRVELATMCGIVLQHNLFAYCNNNPVNECDGKGQLAAQLLARIILGIMLGVFIQLLSDLLSYWYSKLFSKPKSFSPSVGDYISSAISWALTCVTFNSKVVEICATVIPVLIKHVYRAFNNNFDWIDLMLDLLMVLVAFAVGKGISKAEKNKISKIVKKAGKSNKAWNIIRIGTKRLNAKVTVWGIKANLALNISGTIVSNIYSALYAKYAR